MKPNGTPIAISAKAVDHPAELNFGDCFAYALAKVRAAERNTSVSALVKGFRVELASEELGARGLEREERELRARIRTFTAGNRLSRDDAHGRDK
jgi:hypothetical protein